MPLTRLIYVSRRLDGSDAALDDILRVSQARNGEDGITGALLAGDGHFIQMLEGDRALLNRCLGRIIRDPRHEEIQVVSAGEARHRLFPLWAMRRIDLAQAVPLLSGRLAPQASLPPEEMPQLLFEDMFRRLAVELGGPPGA